MGQTFSKKNSAGFTLIELLLVLGIAVILTGVAIPLAWPQVEQNDLDTTADIAVQSLREAQSLAMSESGDSSWGVRLQPQAIVIFKGQSFSARDVSYDEAASLSAAVSYSGLTEIDFEKFSGLPASTGSIVIGNSAGQSRQIDINSLGSVSY